MSGRLRCFEELLLPEVLETVRRLEELRSSEERETTRLPEALLILEDPEAVLRLVRLCGVCVPEAFL